MKLITELIEYCLQHNMLTEEHKLKLQAEGFYTFYPEENEEEESFPIESDEEIRSFSETFEDDLWEAQTGLCSHSSDRRHGKRKNNPDKPKLLPRELNSLVKGEWHEFVNQFPWIRSFWSSWNAGRLSHILADGFTLNDVYTLLSLELRDYSLDYSGAAPKSYRQLLQQRAIAANNYSWLIKYPAIVRMVNFVIMQHELLREVRTLYETQRETFARLSSQNGKLSFPNWEKAVQTDTTSMKVWTILDLGAEPVTEKRLEEVLTWKTALAFAMQIDFDFVTKLATEDWSMLTITPPEKEEEEEDHSTSVTDSKRLKEFLLSRQRITTLFLNEYPDITDADLPQLTGLTHLKMINFTNCVNITDSGLACLRLLPSLKSLYLSFCQEITDSGLAHLAGLTQLHTLNLDHCTSITDSGLAHLAGLTQLQTLNLWGCRKITDSGLAHLTGLTQLRTLILIGCNQITPSGMASLQKALPNCQIR